MPFAPGTALVQVCLCPLVWLLLLGPVIIPVPTPCVCPMPASVCPFSCFSPLSISHSYFFLYGHCPCPCPLPCFLAFVASHAPPIDLCSCLPPVPLAPCHFLCSLPMYIPMQLPMPPASAVLKICLVYLLLDRSWTSSLIAFCPWHCSCAGVPLPPSLAPNLLSSHYPCACRLPL